MFRSKGRISGSNLARVDGPYEHSFISGGVYNIIDNLMMAGRKSGGYLNSLSSRWERYLDPNDPGNPFGMFFTEDGLKVFIVVYSNTAYQALETWTMTEPFGEPTYVTVVDIDDSANFSGTGGTFVHASFSPDGMYLFTNTSSDDYARTYSLSSAYDVSDSSLIGLGKDVKMLPFIANATGSYEVSMYGHEFGNSGLKMYTVGSGLDRIAQYTLSTAYDVTTASYDGYKHINSINSAPSSITWKPDGTTFYMTNFSGDDVHQISVATNWDVTSTTTLVNTFAVDTEEATPMDVRFKTDDGTKMFVIGRGGDGIDTYTLSTGWDISTASHTAFDSLSTENTLPTGLDFSPDGTKMVVAGTTDDELLYYTLSTAWTISSKTYQGLYHTSPSLVSSAYVLSTGPTYYYNKHGISIQEPRSVRYINSGNGISIMGGHQGSNQYHAKVVNYTLGQSYNGLSIIDGLLLDFTTQEGTGNYSYDLKFNNDGTKVYAVSLSDDKIYQWTLDTPYTFSSSNYGMTFDGTSSSFNTLVGETSLRGMSFNDVGDILFVTGGTTEKIWEYTVSTPFDVTSTLAITTSYSVSNQISSINTSTTGEGSPVKIQWTNSGLFFCGTGLQEVYKINFVDK